LSKRYPILITLGRNVEIQIFNVPQKVGKQKKLYIFPPHLTSASALHYETGNTKLHLFT